MLNTLPGEEILVGQSLTEPSAFAEVYDHYVPRVYTYIRYRVSDPQMADDLVAQTFEKALASLKNYRVDQGPFSAWLFGIAHNVVSQHYRAQRRWQWLSLERVWNHASEAKSPEDIAIHKETQQRLMLAVTQLRDRERNLIALKFAAGLKNRQIAEITDLSESNVAVILYRSIKQLKRILSEVGEENE